MRTIVKVFAMAACAMLLGAPLALADDVGDELAEMRALVDQLKNQVDAQSEQIDHQGEVIREARLEQAKQSDERFGASGIAAFLQRIQVDGHVAGSYFYNFNSPGAARSVGGPGFSTGGNTGLSGNVYPFHGNHNSFQVDQVWFGIEHPVDEENRAGFRFDLLYGTTACTLGNAVPIRCGIGGFGGVAVGGFPLSGGGGAALGGFFNDNTSQFYVSQAYVQYLAPITENGILVKAGKFATIVGAEVVQATANFNITRGNVYNILQPLDHVGVIASSDVGDTPYSWQFGVVNDGGNGILGSADPDRNEAKSILAQVGWTGETTSLANSLIWGPPGVFDDGHPAGLYDLVATWDPTEQISTWLNFDYAWADLVGVPGKSHAWGLALAGRFAVTERLGISSRFEVVRTDGGFGGFVNPAGGGTGPGGVIGGPAPSNASIYSITGTADYALTNNLTMRTEIRYDNITKDFGDNEFFDQGGDFRPDQTTAGVELVYEF